MRCGKYHKISYIQCDFIKIICNSHPLYTKLLAIFLKIWWFCEIKRSIKKYSDWENNTRCWQNEGSHRADVFNTSNIFIKSMKISLKTYLNKQKDTTISVLIITTPNTSMLAFLVNILFYLLYSSINAFFDWKTIIFLDYISENGLR